MKRILIITIALCTFLNVQAQSNKQLLGTWEIKNFKYSNHPNNNEDHTIFRKYKLYTPTHFTVIEVNNKTNITTTSIFGTYEIKDGIYIETILNVNRESAGMIGRTFSFTLNFEDDDTMYATGSFNGMKTSERWIRLKKGSDAFVESVKKEVKTPMYVVKNGDRNEIIKPSPANESPLRMIAQDDIQSIEILKERSAIDLFGEPGKNGVVIISVKPEKINTFLELLKSKKLL